MGAGPAQTESSNNRARERKKANQIRTDYQARQTRDLRRTEGPAAGRATGAAMNRNTQLTTAQSAAGARAAGMAQNEASIKELENRLSDAKNPISKINLQDQIKQLGQGGVPVTTTKSGPAGSRYSGETLTVGVVRGGKFTGRESFDPSTGATKFNPMKGAYTPTQGKMVGGTTNVRVSSVSSAGSDNGSASSGIKSSKAAVEAASKNIVTMKGDGLTAAQRKAAGGGGGSDFRRKFLGNVR